MYYKCAEGLKEIFDKLGNISHFKFLTNTDRLIKIYMIPKVLPKSIPTTL
jgi:hypothetical protein